MTEAGCPDDDLATLRHCISDCHAASRSFLFRACLNPVLCPASRDCGCQQPAVTFRVSCWWASVSLPALPNILCLPFLLPPLFLAHWPRASWFLEQFERQNGVHDDTSKQRPIGSCPTSTSANLVAPDFALLALDPLIGFPIYCQSPLTNQIVRHGRSLLLGALSNLPVMKKGPQWRIFAFAEFSRGLLLANNVGDYFRPPANHHLSHRRSNVLFHSWQGLVTAGQRHSR